MVNKVRISFQKDATHGQEEKKKEKKDEKKFELDHLKTKQSFAYPVNEETDGTTTKIYQLYFSSITEIQRSAWLQTFRIQKSI